MIQYDLTWPEFKQTCITDKMLRHQHIESAQGYRVFAVDGPVWFRTEIYKAGKEPDGYGADTANLTEYEATYKATANKTIEPIDSITGFKKGYSTNKPVGTTTFFSGDDESTPVAEIVFNMLATDVSKSVTLAFNQDIYMFGGDISFKDAPLGAHFQIEVLLAGQGPVSSYGKKILFLGSGHKTYVSHEKDIIPAGIGLSIKLTVYNATGTGEHAAPAAFQFCGNLFTYKAVTV